MCAHTHTWNNGYQWCTWDGFVLVIFVLADEAVTESCALHIVLSNFKLHNIKFYVVLTIVLFEVEKCGLGFLGLTELMCIYAHLGITEHYYLHIPSKSITSLLFKIFSLV